jgi:hypothetical protein
MANLLIAAYGLVAELSAARLAVQTGAPPLNPAICEWLQALLAGQPAAAGAAEAGPLAAAGLAVTSAARTYEQVAKSEAR